MKILLCADACPQTTAYYYELALRELPHEVATLGPLFTADDLHRWKVAEQSNLWGLGEEAAFGVGHPNRRYQILEKLPQHRDVVTWPNAGPWRLETSDVDLVIWIDAGLDRLQLDLSDIEPYTRTVAIVGDLRNQTARQIEHAAQFDRVYVQFTPGRAEEVRDRHGRPAGWLPPAADKQIHAPQAVCPEKLFDVGFIGCTNPRTHPGRVSFLFALMDAGLDVAIDSQMHEEATLFYQRCVVLVNHSLDGDINMRVAETLASGGVLVTDDVEGIDEYREACVCTFTSIAEGVEMARAVCWEPEDKLQSLGEKSADAILDRHTYDHRVRQILDDVEADVKEGER